MTSSTPKKIKNEIGDVVLSKTTFEWSIENFRDCCENVGDLIYSPVFTHGSHLEFSWRLELYPHGRNEESSDFFSLYLRNKSLHNVRTSFVLSIKDMDPISARDDLSWAEIEHAFTSYESGKGFLKFASRYDIVFYDDVLTIKCKIFGTSIINQLTDSRTYNTNAKFNALGDIGQLYNNKNLSDVTVRVDSKEFQAHKAILSARSEVFAAMFKHDIRKNVVEIKDIKSEIMDAVLKFMYTGETEKIDLHLLVAADRYAITDLVDICILKLSQIINVDNAMNFLVFAECYNLYKLERNAIDYIVDNAEEIIEESGFESIKNVRSEKVINLFSKLASKI